MRFEIGALSLALALAGASTGCGFVVSGDEALADEFARFKAAGGRCTGAPPPASGAALNAATRYGSLVFGALLGEAVAPSGRVRYPRLIEDPEQQAALRLAVEQLAAVDPGRLATRGERLAFWVNAYNLLVLDGAQAGFAADPAFRVDQNGFAFFDLRVHEVGGRLFSLNEIEHGVIRGARTHPSTGSLPDEEWEALFALHEQLWGGDRFDARVHFVLNCASSSCPPLFPFAWNGARIDDQMEEATSAFLQDEEHGAGPQGISEIFAFYEEDFLEEGGVPAFISRYRPLAEVDVGRFLAYDWSLNLAAD